MTKVFITLAGISLVGAYVVGLLPAAAQAESLVSPSYRFEETTIGNGGMLESNSENFRSSLSIGDTAVDNSSSDNFQFESGSQTTSDPALTFMVNNFDVEFGSFTPSSATVATSTFSVINYTSYGYVVQIIGEPPTNGDHTIEAMEETGPSVAGSEQFGINVVANTSPESVGANPDHGEFGVGDPAPNYATPNNFRYVSGEAIAIAPESSGETTYTISYIVNVESLTPGGHYSSHQSLICTGTY